MSKWLRLINHIDALFSFLIGTFIYLYDFIGFLIVAYVLLYLKEEYKEEYEEEATHYPETSAIEKAPAALETQVEAANEQDQTEVENASAAE